MRRGEADAVKSFDLVDGFDQLNEGGFFRRGAGRARHSVRAVVCNLGHGGQRTARPTIHLFCGESFAITRHDLAEQRDFSNALRNELATLGHDLGDAAAAFFAARVGHDAEGAVLIAALHDADERGHGFILGVAVEQMFLDRAFATLFFCGINNLVAFALKNFIEVFRCAMKLLRAEYEVNIRQAINQFLAATLRHAAHESEDDVGAILAYLSRDVLHLVDGFLLGVIAHAASVEQHHIRDVFGRGECVALGDELSGDGFAVALVHLATVSFDIDARHLRSAGEVLKLQRLFVSHFQFPDEGTNVIQQTSYLGSHGVAIWRSRSHFNSEITKVHREIRIVIEAVER